MNSAYWNTRLQCNGRMKSYDIDGLFASSIKNCVCIDEDADSSRSHIFNKNLFAVGEVGVHNPGDVNFPLSVQSLLRMDNLGKHQNELLSGYLKFWNGPPNALYRGLYAGLVNILKTMPNDESELLERLLLKELFGNSLSEENVAEVQELFQSRRTKPIALFNLILLIILHSPSLHVQPTASKMNLLKESFVESLNVALGEFNIGYEESYAEKIIYWSAFYVNDYLVGSPMASMQFREANKFRCTAMLQIVTRSKIVQSILDTAMKGDELSLMFIKSLTKLRVLILLYRLMRYEQTDPSLEVVKPLNGMVTNTIIESEIHFVSFILDRVSKELRNRYFLNAPFTTMEDILNY